MGSGGGDEHEPRLPVVPLRLLQDPTARSAMKSVEYCRTTREEPSTLNALMLLWLSNDLSCGCRLRAQRPYERPDLASHEALQAPDDLGLGAALGRAALDVGDGRLVE